MITSLRGTITTLRDNFIVVEVNNIGYKVYTPSRHQFVPGSEIFIYTYLVVRENILDLYGFPIAEELEYFELLMTVPKIGPKSALKILGQADIYLLNSAIINQDPDQLHKLAGIGKKTASNITTHLEGKVEPIFSTDQTDNTLSSSLSPNQIDAIDALITLGYDPKSARDYVLKSNQADDTKSIIQSVLKQIPIP